jgi:hypothetical protein
MAESRIFRTHCAHRRVSQADKSSSQRQDHFVVILSTKVSDDNSFETPASLSFTIGSNDEIEWNMQVDQFRQNE